MGYESIRPMITEFWNCAIIIVYSEVYYKERSIFPRCMPVECVSEDGTVCTGKLIV